MTSELDSATTRQPIFTTRERGARSMMERQLSDHDRNHLHIKLFSRYRPTYQRTKIHHRSISSGHRECFYYIFKFAVRFSSHNWNRFQFLVRANYTVFFCLTNARSPKENLTETWDETSFIRQVRQKSIAVVVSFICQFFLICNSTTHTTRIQEAIIVIYGGFRRNTSWTE